MYINMQVGVQQYNELQRAKIGVRPQNEQEQQLLMKIDNNRAKDKVIQKARQEKNKNKQKEERQKQRLARQEQQHDQQNNLIQYGKNQSPSIQQQDQTNANKNTKKQRRKQPSLAEKRELYAAEGGDKVWWKCDLCDTMLKKDDKKNQQHRWNKQCARGIRTRMKMGYITQQQYEKMLIDKQTIQKPAEVKNSTKKKQNEPNKKRKAEEQNDQPEEQNAKKKK
jgi:hypothetical protein